LSVACLPESVVDLFHPLDADQTLFEKYLGMHFGYDDLFVMRTVENADASLFGQVPEYPPQESVLQLLV
jgi:hypothetical protein